MKTDSSRKKAAQAVVIVALLATVSAVNSRAQTAQTVPVSFTPFAAGDLLVSSSTYEGTASTVTVGQSLPGGGNAVTNGSFGPTGVFTNDVPDSSFGVTAPIILSELTTTGTDVEDINVTAALAAAGDKLSTSFSSKSELALNLTPDGSGITFMGYATSPNQLDISNSNTPAVASDTGNTDTAPATYRVVAQLNANGTIETTDTNAYPGNNGRAAVLGSNGNYYTVGNAGNGGSGASTTTQYTGVQSVTPGANATTSTPNSVGTYNITQQGDPADKPAKDNNFRGETIYNNTLYVTKGSGSNGVNTVYQVGTTGSLPTGSSNTISVLPGFTTTTEKNGNNTHPFGLFFANASTLYVADEGDGVYADVGTAANGPAGLNKYSLVNGVWILDYTLTLNLGMNQANAYTVNGSGPGGNYTAVTDGLRNITGVVNPDGTVSIYGVTSTVDNYTGQDAGADPNKLVEMTDLLSNTSATVGDLEGFNTLETAAYGQVLRGVSFTPEAAPEPSTWALLLGGIATLVGMARRRQCRIS